MILLASRRLRDGAKRWFVVSAMLRCTSVGFHELLPYPPDWKPATPSYFLEGLNRVGVSKIFFLRHGQTGRSETGVDFDRRLTETGREQASAAGQSFGRNKLLPFYKKALVSPAPRTVETAEIFLQSSLTRENHLPELVRVPDLYDQTMQPAGSRLFAKIGYAALLDYIGASGVEDRQVAQDVLSKYAASAVRAIDQVVAHDPVAGEASNSSLTMLVVGHAIYLPAAALGVASLVGSCMDQNAQVDVVLSTNTQEAEGYLIDLRQAKVDYLSRTVV